MATADQHLSNPSKPTPSQLKTNLAYLVKGPSGTAVRPASLGTRSTLRTVRYVAKFVFFRLIRYFKYALVAAGVTALAGTALGASIPWIAAIAVPSVPMAAAIGATTAAIKFSWRHRGNHFRQAWLVGGEGRSAREDEKNDAHDSEEEFGRAARRATGTGGHPRAEDAWSQEKEFI